MRRALLVSALLAGMAPSAGAWPAETMTSVGRDALRLLPRSLARLLGEREPQIQDELGRFPQDLALAIAEDRRAGALRPETIAGVDAEVGRAVELLRQRQVSEGLVRLGGLVRITADLSDPVLAVAAEDWPAGVAREYYALFAANQSRMPVVLDDPTALELSRRELPRLWQSLVERSRAQVPTIREELFRGGRTVSHTQLDYRSPAWAVASLAYSRAVTATAATWLAAWREARGDLTNRTRPRVAAPREDAGALAGGRTLSRPEAP